MAPTLDFWLYLPQMRMSMSDLVERARMAQAAGFSGIAGMDHLAPPLAESSPMFEAMVTSTWLAAHTERLRVGSLVLCDAFRHPVVLARQAVTLDHASEGRFELGIGWGSVPEELHTFGIVPSEPKARIRRLKETLEIVEALWAGETLDYHGEYFTLAGAHLQPGPLTKIPLTIGGAGRRTLELVAAHADWWNVHIGIVDRLDEMRPFSGSARCSLQVQVAYVREPATRGEITETARRRFGTAPVVGSAPELVEYFGALTQRGVERVYAWFCDFAAPETILAFGEDVIGAFAERAGSSS